MSDQAPTETKEAPIDIGKGVLGVDAPQMAKPQGVTLEDEFGKLPIGRWRNTGRIWHIFISPQAESLAVGDSAFSFNVPLYLDGARILWVGLATISSSASGGPILVNLAIGANDLLTTRISMADGDKYSWKTGNTVPVIDQTYAILRSGDQIDVDVDDIGDGAAFGWQLFLFIQ